MDRRQKKTRQAVYRSFTALLETKPYSAISVQEIIDGADVGRSTFYAHFETKDALLESLCQEIFDHVFSNELTSEASHDFSDRARDLRAELTHILYHLQDDRTFVRRILARESGELFMRYFKRRLEGVFARELEGCVSDVPQDYLLHHMVCDFAETVRWWMDRGGYPPEEVCRFFLSTTPFA
ncbi:MAG: TetR/AcrR family transcriptional regulator [Oscillospiraceae bacterium]|nr:TetR/AcrR family transcriptional regulator [Oscillospiraceae bacterium]